MAHLQYKRLVVKAGTGVLTGGTGRLDLEVMSGLVSQIAGLRSLGAEVVLVTSGAVAAGRDILLTRQERRGIPFRQVLAAVGQSHLMHFYEQRFAEHCISVAQALLTWKDLSDRQGYLNVRNTLLALLELGVGPVLNVNDVVAVDEIGEVLGDNDRLSALVANLIDADLLALLTDTDGLHTADPRVDPDARLITRVEKIDSSIEALAGSRLNPNPRGGMSTKLEAARLATSSGVATVICNGWERDVLPRLARGEGLGTMFPPTSSRLESRKRWMLSEISARGEIVVDQGAALVLRGQNRSLLPVGVLEVKGEFHRGDIVYIVALGGEKVACGIVSYDSQDIARIKGEQSDRIQGVLGYHYGQEVMHRNNMVLL
ncbi:MAG: glutamate 5-kinase [Dehalococcoidia bacterium]|nr:glutamate 5-kinase [Dehalococcoidia bacterium]